MKTYHEIIQNAHAALEREKQALEALAKTLDDTLVQTVCFLADSPGRLIVTGVGKSGHIARKIAATMASLGKPSQFIHATEASHGDFGMLSSQDSILALSWSGKTREIVEVATYAKEQNIPLIAFTARRNSPLAQMAQFLFILPDLGEIDSLTLAPTISTTLQLVMGDILAVSVSQEKGFTAHQFKQFHPAGALGTSLIFARDIMETTALPLLTNQATLAQALVRLAQSRFSCLGVIDASGKLIGTVSDSAAAQNMNHLEKSVQDIMHPSPQTVAPETLGRDVLDIMNAFQLHAIFVVEDRRPIGMIAIHDLLKYGFGS